MTAAQAMTVFQTSPRVSAVTDTKREGDGPPKPHGESRLVLAGLGKCPGSQMDVH